MRALGGGVESPDAFDLVAKEINAVGFVRIVGVEVDQATTGGDLARLLTEGFGVVIEIVCEGVD